MDFSKRLQSRSVRDQAEAAMFLRAQGGKRAEYLPELLACCEAVDVVEDLDRFEEALLGYGALTMSDIVDEVGFDTDNYLHQSILDWIAGLTLSANIRVAVHSIYGLGNLKSLHPVALQRLLGLAGSERRSDEHEHVSLRAIAFRMLRRLDSSIAEKFVDLPAFEEYAHAVEHWTTTNLSKNADNQRELQCEVDWIAEVKTRRTKP